MAAILAFPRYHAPPMARTTVRDAPRYAQLAEQLAREISEGKYAVGGLLPPELELSRAHKVSRHTVREALRRLTDMGLISRRRRTGTVITAKGPNNRYTASITSMEELFQYDRRPRYKVLSEELISAGPAEAALLKCRQGTRWMKFEASRFHTGSRDPISYTEFYVDPAYREVGENLRQKNPLIYSFIERHFEERVIEMQQEIGAVAVPARAAAQLKVKPRSPGLHVVRRFAVHGNRVIAVSSSVYAEGRFQVSTRWKVEWSKQGT
jgi:GntR family transcriptional regulator